ncbi:MAG: M1 family aminopeptidase, partial [Chitinophagaceae bacterium]
MPYLDQGEFYSEWASYNVQITVPENYVVAAPGLLANPAEKSWLQQRARFSLPKPAVKSSSPSSKAVPAVIPSSSPTKTLLYTLDRAHDFAWFADKSYIVNQDTVQLPSGKTIELWSYYWPGSRSLWEKSISYMKDAVRFRSAQIGEYPYASLSAVEAKMGFPGGMEYPTITAISSIKDAKSLDLSLQHEIGHNWFYGVLASNEREHPWMDEGINTFYDLRYEEEKYPAVKSKGKPHQRDLLSPYIVMVQRQEKLHLAQPITTSAVAFTPDNYWLIAYYKTALWLRELEKQLGKSMFDSSLRSYFQHWQFKHPQPEDFFQEVEQVSGHNLVDFRRMAGENTSTFEKQAAPQRKGLSLRWDPLAPAQQKFHVAPVPGYNFYDGLMLGAALHNYTILPAHFQVVTVAQYGLQSKRVNGLGYLN